MVPTTEHAARELLDFYVEAGVDAIVGEEPIDRLSDSAATQAPHSNSSASAQVGRHSESGDRHEKAKSAILTPSSSLPDNQGTGKTRAVASTPLAPDAATMAAREAARSARTLEELRAILEAFDGCSLKQSATQLVFADGNPASRLMLVGEAPGRDEDIEGRPFVGRSGKLLDRILAAIGLDRTSVYIANIVPWRPPGNRTPTPQESQICLPFILRQIELADPDILVCLGGPSAQTLLGVKEGITKARGRWFTFNTGKREIRAMPTFHPAFLLRSPLQKRFAWRDFLAIKKALDSDQR